MKYIIEFEDKPIKGVFADSENHYQCKQIPSWAISGKGLNKLTPYTEPDRKDIEDEVWEFVRYMSQEMLGYQRHECFGTTMTLEVVRDMSFQDAKAKYKAWKKQKDEIHVGDEVEYVCCDETVRFVVTGISGGNRAYGFKYPCEYDDSGEYCDLDQLRKTGRHFDEVAELLKAMKGEE